jgi:hypothetical protein
MEKDEPPTFETVCRVDEIPEGEARMFAVAETMISIGSARSCRKGTRRCGIAMVACRGKKPILTISQQVEHQS